MIYPLGVLEVSEIPDKVTLGGLIVLFFDSLPEPLLQDSFQALVATKGLSFPDLKAC